MTRPVLSVRDHKEHRRIVRLSIIRTLTERLGGTVTADYEQGRLTITVQLKKCKKTAAEYSAAVFAARKG